MVLTHAITCSPGIFRTPFEKDDLKASLCARLLKYRPPPLNGPHPQPLDSLEESSDVKRDVSCAVKFALIATSFATIKAVGINGRSAFSLAFSFPLEIPSWAMPLADQSVMLNSMLFSQGRRIRTTMSSALNSNSLASILAESPLVFPSLDLLPDQKMPFELLEYSDACSLVLVARDLLERVNCDPRQLGSHQFVGMA